MTLKLAMITQENGRLDANGTSTYTANIASLMATNLNAAGTQTGYNYFAGDFGLETHARAVDYYAGMVAYNGWAEITKPNRRPFGNSEGPTGATSDVGFLTFNFSNCDNCIIGYMSDGSYGSFQWRIDGGAWNVVDQSTYGAYKIPITGLTLAPHVIEVQWVSGTAAIHYFDAYNSADALSLMVTGHFYARFGPLGLSDVGADWVYSVAFDPNINTGYLEHDAILINIGIGDVESNLDQATFNTNSRAFLDKYTTDNPGKKIIIVAPNDIAGGLGWSDAGDLTSDLQTLASEYADASFFDVKDAPGLSDYTTASANGYMFSGTEMTPTAAQIAWDYLTPLIRAELIAGDAGADFTLRNHQTLVPYTSPVKCVFFNDADFYDADAKTPAAYAQLTPDANGRVRSVVPGLTAGNDYKVSIGSQDESIETMKTITSGVV